MSNALASREISIDGQSVEIAARRSPRARRIILRFDPTRDEITLVVPKGARMADAWAFAESQRDWLRHRLRQTPERVAFAEGSIIPFRGKRHRLRHFEAPTSARRGVVWVDAANANAPVDPDFRGDDALPILYVGGAPEHMTRRLTDWLKRQAREELTARVHEKAASIDRAVAHVGIRDPKSRWGSCSHEGRLAFSWRLILAPHDVLDYVAAHEVAHLVELNHSVRFWRLANELCDRMEWSRRWLRRHGMSLHRYG